MTNYALPQYSGTFSNTVACAKFEEQGKRGQFGRVAKRIKAKQEFLAASQAAAIRAALARKKRRKFAHACEVEAGEFNPLKTNQNT